MEVACAPVIFQETMNRLLCDLDYVSVYILQKEDEPDEELRDWKLSIIYFEVRIS